MCLTITEPQSPYEIAVQIRNMKCEMIYGKWFFPNQRSKHSTFRRVIAFAGANLRFILDSLDFDFNGAKLSIACLVCRVVTKTVLRSNFGSDLSKRFARIT